MSCWFALLAFVPTVIGDVSSLDLTFLLGLAPFVLALIGLIVGLTGVRHPRGRGWAIAGIILNSLYFLAGLLVGLSRVMESVRYWSR